MKKPAAGASARDKILHYLKTKGPQSANDLAQRLGVTPIAVRQHLVALQDDGLCEYEDERRPVGRPARIWRRTRKADERFPDSHSELAISMLNAVRAAYGEEGVKRLMQERVKQLASNYSARMSSADRSVEARAERLAAMRSEEGYMAEAIRCEGGEVLLVENHCPICTAAETCAGICDAELDLFRIVLGDGVSVVREEHIISGDRRCSYRIAETLS